MTAATSSVWTCGSLSDCVSSGSHLKMLMVAAGKARALSDPTRLMLAAALLEANELCVCDLAWIAERSQTLVSHHVRALRGARSRPFSA